MLPAQGWNLKAVSALFLETYSFNTFCLSRDGECLAGKKLLWFHPFGLQCAAECCIVFVCVGAKSLGRELEQKWDYVKILEMSSTFHNDTDFRDFETTSKACQGICKSLSGMGKKYPNNQNPCA